jgi:serine protease Do
LADQHEGSDGLLTQLDALARQSLATSPAGGVVESQLNRVLVRPMPLNALVPKANDEVSRGPAAAVYAKAAPAIVFIQSGNSFGSGFIVDGAGWIITNEHVVADAPIHVQTGARVVKVIVGHLQDGVMSPEPTARAAWVYKTDARADLALLKLDKPASAPLPIISLASQTPPPGSDCVAIGHPKAGLLWTVRSGQISGVGQWPRDSWYALTTALSSSGLKVGPRKNAFVEAPQREILVTSCGINPGDSGGPLLDEEGRLIAVTFGIPKNISDPGVSLDKFAYHVHLDEVKKFLQARPAHAEPFVPSPWPAAVASTLLDVDGDGVPETLVFVAGKDQPLTGYQCDLSESTSRTFDARKLDDQEMRKLWHFQFAFIRTPVRRTFYDTRNSGQIDLILSDFNSRGVADMMLRLEEGAWHVSQPNDQKMLDPALFTDAKLGDRLARIQQAMTAPKKPAVVPAPAAAPKATPIPAGPIPVPAAPTEKS